MKPKQLFLTKFSLEHGKDGIVFINNIPLFADIESVAKQLQIFVWLNTPITKDTSKEYIR